MKILRTFAVLLASAAASCGGPGLEETAIAGGLPALPGGDLDRSTYLGALAYERYCAVCHGEGAEGDGANATLLPTPPPSLLRLVARREAPDQDISLDEQRLADGARGRPGLPERRLVRGYVRAPPGRDQGPRKNKFPGPRAPIRPSSKARRGAYPYG